MARKKGEVFGRQARSVELLWRAQERPRPGPKPGLSLDRIVQASIELADAEGLDAISMQRVAGAFGFTTMSLYRYVPGKAELIDLMIDMSLGPPPDLSTVAGGWRPRIEVWAQQLWEGMQRHPWVLAATARLRHMGPNELGWLEAALGALSETGLKGRDLFDAFLLVLGHVRSAAQFFVPGGPGPQGITSQQWQGAVSELLSEGQENRFPVLKTALASGAFAPPREPLAFGLRCVLDGIDVLANAGKRRR